VRSTARAWFATHTHRHDDFSVDRLVAAKQRSGERVSVVVPARDEEATIAAIVATIRSELVDAHGLVDEIVVADSLSSDATAEVAAKAGATVIDVRDVVPEVEARPGKGEALWRSLFVAGGDVLVFVDADLTHWGSHFVTGLLGPALTSQDTLLVKGFYDRIMEGAPPEAGHRPQGGRVTELVARPLLAQMWPDLAAVVQPLAGEWAVRRSLFETLSVPVGYGVEFATLVDTYSRFGLDAIAQVDLGARAHQHQSVHDLGVMAAEIIAVARRRADGVEPAEAELAQYRRDGDGSWDERPVPVTERPPAISVPAYGSRRRS
jgi:glucosyl-3-phosphoglycerate synthase